MGNERRSIIVTVSIEETARRGTRVGYPAAMCLASSRRSGAMSRQQECIYAVIAVFKSRSCRPVVRRFRIDHSMRNGSTYIEFTRQTGRPRSTRRFTRRGRNLHGSRLHEPGSQRSQSRLLCAGPLAISRGRFRFRNHRKRLRPRSRIQQQ